MSNQNQGVTVLHLHVDTLALYVSIYKEEMSYTMYIFACNMSIIYNSLRSNMYLLTSSSNGSRFALSPGMYSLSKILNECNFNELDMIRNVHEPGITWVGIPRIASKISLDLPFAASGIILTYDETIEFYMKVSKLFDNKVIDNE